MKNKKTGFVRFAEKFFAVCLVVFVIGIIGAKSIESSYTREAQILQSEITTAQNDIGTLKMQKQELVSFSHLASVASSKGYNYQTDAASSPTAAADVDNTNE